MANIIKFEYDYKNSLEKDYDFRRIFLKSLESIIADETMTSFKIKLADNFPMPIYDPNSGEKIFMLIDICYIGSAMGAYEQERPFQFLQRFIDRVRELGYSRSIEIDMDVPMSCVLKFDDVSEAMKFKLGLF